MSIDPNEPRAIDPVCGRPVDPLRARAVGIFGGTTYYFCSSECKAGYADPRRSTRQDEPAAPSTMAKGTLPPPAPRIPEETAPQPTPRARSRLPLAAIVIGGAAIAGAALWMHGRSPAASPPQMAAQAPQTPTTTPAEQRAPAAPAAVAAKPEAEVAPKPAPDPAQTLGELTPPLKLGLRRFVEQDGDHASVVARLLVIDASGRSTPVEIARATIAPELVKSVGTEAVVPGESYASASAAPGIVFTDTIALGADQLEVRVARTAEGLSAESRTVRTEAGGNAAAWQRRLFAPLPTTATVRGAAFAKKRYLPDAPTSAD